MLTLGISTSSGQFAVVIGEKGKVLFNSSVVDFPAPPGLAERLAGGLEATGRETREIGNILVDTGPGGTSRVRTGISFANALAYALGVTVCPVTSIELSGVDAWDRYRLPVLHVAKSIKGNVHAGIADGGRCLAMAYGTLEEVVPRLAVGRGKLVVSGARREEVLRLGEREEIPLEDGGMEYGEARFLVEKEGLFVARALRFPAYARPVTEQTR
ncbi:MAG: hypothetical protein LBD64_07015 [Odoribacteraceae bacterium]|jgi:tRNA A37 threonylcarbamoyladenosine modification protein TsaB|nr:hypothetical protein [Odoribacteraceae bacterium]